jgi:hypothetical protein
LSEGRHRQAGRTATQTKSRPSPPPRPPDRRRRAPLGLLVLPAALVAVIVGALLFLGGGKVVRNLIGQDVTPEFDFKMGKTVAISTNEKFTPPDLQSKADDVAQEALPTIDALFSGAYLDPNNWKDGSYDSALDQFEDVARPTAERELATLTLGPDAGQTYASVSPGKSKVWFRVLFDGSGNPSEAVAQVRFHALGKQKDGTYMDVTAHGEFFLRGDEWKIYAFTIGRSDHETTPPAGPSPGASSSPSS